MKGILTAISLFFIQPRQLICPYCGDIKNTKRIWQGRLRYTTGDVLWFWPFTWYYDFWDKAYKKCRCDLGLVMPPHLHPNNETPKECSICLEWI
jgi:hypothetical protein